MIPINKITYIATEDNNFYSKTKEKKKQIIIDVSLRKDNYHIIRLQNLKLNDLKKWSNYSVSRKGKIFQHFNDDYYSDFMGNKKIDKQIISIVLENMGYLGYVDYSYVNCLNEVCEINNIINIDWLDIKFWEKINNIQIKNTAKLCAMLCEKHNIRKKCIDFFHFHENIYNFDGIVFKSNYDENSLNFNPSFDIELFNNLLRQ